jgi:hypothetical protein
MFSPRVLPLRAAMPMHPVDRVRAAQLFSPRSMEFCMPIRLLAFALLAGSSIALAAPRGSNPPKAGPAPQHSPEAIDVDAMARAKDVDAAASDASSEGVGKSAADEAPPDDTTAPEPAGDVSTDAHAPAQAVPDEPPPDVSAPSTQTSGEPPADEAAPSQQTSDESSAAATPTEAAASDTPEAATQSDASQAASQSDTAQSDTTPPDAAERSIAAGCESRAAALLDDAQKADYGSVTRDFDAKMRSELPAPRFQQQWESLAQFGKLVARGRSHLGRGEGYTIVVIPLIFEKANLVAQIACGSDGRIAGFHVTPAPKPQF